LGQDDYIQIARGWANRIECHNRHMKAAELYDRDFAEWTRRNAELLRSGRAAEADLDHIAEEIEDMGSASGAACIIGWCV
jgi:hypothetical protein